MLPLERSERRNRFLGERSLRVLPGQYYDVETGKHHNYYRDYDPAIGRYIESDPIGLKGGSNTFAYVKGNALSLIDRLGLLVGFGGCNAKQRSEIEHADRRVRNFFGSHCGGCNDPTNRCVDCGVADK